MKLTAAQIAPFLQKPDPAVTAILIYGPDAGLVRERADLLAKKTVPDINDPFRTAALTSAAITDDPARLSDEMSAQALGGGRRLIRVSPATDGIAAALSTLIESGTSGDSLLLLEAGDLDKRSKLRAFCESNGSCAALPCYVEDGAIRQRTVTDILQAEGLSIARDVLMYLCDILPPDRAAMRSELDKLALYAKGQKAVTLGDVQATIYDAGAAELDDLIFAVGKGEGKRAALLIDRLFAEQTSTVAILRAAQRHFMRLQWARQHMDAGLSANEAIKKLQPPVFWSHSDSMVAQVRRWPRLKIERALTRLYEAEAAVKRTGTPEAALCAQLLLGMAA